MARATMEIAPRGWVVWGWLNRLLGMGATAARPIPGSAAFPLDLSPSTLSGAAAGVPTHPAHLKLLAKFRYPADPTDVGKDYWNAVLPDPVGDTLAQFRGNCWLVDAPWQEVFSIRHRTDDLKGLLRDRGLRVSGKKAELAARLIECDMEGMRLRVAGVKAWVLAPTVAGIVEQHMLSEKSAETRARGAALSALREGRVRAAVDTIVAHERTRVFPRGMGIDWHRDDIANHMVVRAQAILRASPRIVSDVPEHELELLRPAAAMLELTGESRCKPWLPAGLVGHPRLDIETVVRMLLFHGSNITRLQGLQDAGYKQVDIMTCGSASCPTCQAMDGKTFAIDRAPELPHPDCSHELGCRCLYQPHVDY